MADLSGGAGGGDNGGGPPAELGGEDTPVCPRCGVADPISRFYGPCGTCRDELGRTMRRIPRRTELQAYVPRSNVVANHVATRE